MLWQPVHNGTVLRYLNIGEDLHMENKPSLEHKYHTKLQPSEPNSGCINYSSVYMSSIVFAIVAFNRLIANYFVRCL